MVGRHPPTSWYLARWVQTSFVMLLKTWLSLAFLKTYTSLRKHLCCKQHLRVLFLVFVCIYLNNQVSSHYFLVTFKLLRNLFYALNDLHSAKSSILICHHFKQYLCLSLVRRFWNSLIHTFYVCYQPLQGGICMSFMMLRHGTVVLYLSFTLVWPCFEAIVSFSGWRRNDFIEYSCINCL